MMKREINLLPSELKEERRAQKVKSSLGGISLIILAISVILAGSVWAISLNLKVHQKNLKKDSQTIQGKVSDLSVVDAEASRLQSKLLAIKQIIAERNQYSLLLETISKASPPEVAITSLSTYGDGRLSLNGDVQSYSTLSKLITSFLDPALGGSVFKSADLTGASLDEVSGKIKFSITLHVADKGLKKSL